MKKSVRPGVVLGVLIAVGLSLGLVRCLQPEPPATEQVDVEKVWTISPMHVPESGEFGWEWQRPMAHQIGMDETVQPGTLFASQWLVGLGDSPTRVSFGRPTVTAESSFVGANQPSVVWKVNETATALEKIDPAIWDWSAGQFTAFWYMRATVEHKQKVLRTVDQSVRPDWYPQRGAASDDRPVYGITIPQRYELVYRFATKTVARGRDWAGSYTVYGPPAEFIVARQTESGPRLVGFRLVGDKGSLPESVRFSHDGNWMYGFDAKTKLVWFVPLHLAWAHFDNEPPSE